MSSNHEYAGPNLFFCLRSRSQPQKEPQRKWPKTHGLRKFPDPYGTGIVLPTINILNSKITQILGNQPTNPSSHGFRMRCIESTVATIPPKARTAVLHRASPAEVPKVSRRPGGKQSRGVSGGSGQSVQIINTICAAYCICFLNVFCVY